MPKIDMSGFAGVAQQGGSSGSAAYMFAGNAAAKTIGYDESSDIVLSRTADWTGAVGLQYMFAECGDVESADLTDICRNTQGVDMTGMFSGCAKMTRAAIAVSDAISATTAEEASAIADKIGVASSLEDMFFGCTSLLDVDLTGVGTYGTLGTINRYGTADTAMAGMFSGCSSLHYDATTMSAMEQAKELGEQDDLDAARAEYDARAEAGEVHAFGKVTIGPAFTKVMNGFFAYRKVADVRPIYLLAADVYVYGGPYAIGGASDTERSNLMRRPDVGGYSYFGEVMFADGAATERNNAVTSGGVKGLWTIQGYFDLPTPAVSVSFEAGMIEDGAVTSGWGADVTVTPAAQPKPYRSAKYRLASDGTRIERTKDGAPIERGSVTAPTAVGFAAADETGEVASSPDQIAWYFAEDYDFAVYPKTGDATGAMEVLHFEAGDSAEALFGIASLGPIPRIAEYEGEGADVDAVPSANGYAPASPAETADGYTQMTAGDAGTGAKLYTDAPQIRLICTPAEISYPVRFVDTAQGKALDYGTLRYSGEGLRLPSIGSVQDKEGTSTDADWTRPGYEFLGWTLGATAPATWTDERYLMPGTWAGADASAPVVDGAKLASVTGGAMSGYATTPAILYAQWAKTPAVTYHVNNSTSWAAYVATPGATPGEGETLIGEGTSWAYIVSGAKAETGVAGLAGGTVDALGGKNALPDDKVDHTSPVAGSPVRAEGTRPHGATMARLSTFEVAVPDAYKQTIRQSDSGWCVDVSCTSAPAGLFTHNRTWAPDAAIWRTSPSIDLYRRIGDAVLTIDFEPGFVSPEGAYSPSIPVREDATEYELPANRFTRDGYAFATWTATWGRSAEEGRTYWVDQGDGRGRLSVTPVAGRQVLLPMAQGSGQEGLSNRAKLSPDAFEALFASGADTCRMTATWSERTYRVTMDLAGGWSDHYRETDEAGLPYFQYKISDTIPPKVLEVYAPKRGGYDFTGWTGSASVIENEVGWQLAASTYNDHAITATWRAYESKISYAGMEGARWGATPGAQGYTADERVEIPTPIKDGYTFVGWSDTGRREDARSPYVIEKGSYGNLTLTAIFDANTYPIEYVLNGGAWADEDAERVAYVYQPSWTADYVLPTPVRAGYTFRGWTGTDITTPQKTVAIKAGSWGSRSYTANWQVVGYHITWNMNGAPGAGYADSYTTEGEYSFAPPVWADHEFLGWSGEESLRKIGITSGLATGTLKIPKGVTGDLTFTAEWRISEYKVTFDAGAFEGAQGSFVDNGSGHYGTLTSGITGITDPLTRKIALPDATWGIECEHAVLAGWSVSAQGAATWKPGDEIAFSELLAFATSTGEVKLIAQWASSERAIAYHALGGDIAAGEGGSADYPTTYYMGEGVTAEALAKATPARAGYIFSGWYSTPTYDEGTLVESIGADATGPVELFARWDYRVRYEGAGAAGATLPFADATPANTHVLTWYACGSYLSERELGTGYGPEMEAAINAKAATATVAPAGPDASSTWTATGYAFAGYWSTSTLKPGDEAAEASRVAAGTSANGRLQPASDTQTATLFAAWAPVTYTVSLALPADMPDASADALFDAMAKEEGSAWTVTTEGEVRQASTVVTYGRGWATPAATPTWAAHAFVGWVTAVRGEGGWEPATGDAAHTFGAGASVTTDIASTQGATATILATFEVSDHATLVLDANGGTKRTLQANKLFPERYVVNGTTRPNPVTLPGSADLAAIGALPYEREGYAFAGWKWSYVGAAGTTVSGYAALDEAGNAANGDDASAPATDAWQVALPDASVTSEVACVAQWEALPYRLAYFENAKAADADTTPVMVADGLAYGSPTPIEIRAQGDGMGPEGMSLSGWSVTRNGSGELFSAGDDVMLEDIVDEARSWKQGDAESGYTEVVVEGKAVREVRLYGIWSARISGTVPARLALAFDPAANDGFGGFLDGTGQIESTTLRPLKVASLSSSWVRGDGADKAGIEAIWPNTVWSYLATTELVVTDSEGGYEASMGAGDPASVATKDTSTGEVIAVPGSDASAVGAGFKIPAATATRPSTLSLTYGIRLNTGMFSKPVVPPPASFEGGMPICTLVYTIGLDEAE